MNAYIKLFERLAKEGTNTLVPLKNFADLGFFEEDFKRMHEEGFIFLKRISETIDNNNNSNIIVQYIKLAPKGFNALEDYIKYKRDDARNNVLRDATILLALSAMLGIIIQMWDNLKIIISRSIWPNLTLAGFWIIFSLFIILLTLRLTIMIFSKESWKGILFKE